MKKAFLILGVVAVSAAAGGFTAWKVAAPREGSVQYIEREVERTPALGTHFTSYQAEQYPDLTYAAENAVKAVVNIEAVQQVEMPGAGVTTRSWSSSVSRRGMTKGRSSASSVPAVRVSSSPRTAMSSPTTTSWTGPRSSR